MTSHPVLQWTPEYVQLNEQECREQLKVESIWNEVPMYQHGLEYGPFQLVRIRGMIQDMSNPEIYLEKFQVDSSSGSRLINGKYRDQFGLPATDEINQYSSKNQHGDRRSLVLITIPALNTWTQHVKNERNDEQSTKSVFKRSIDRSDEMEVDQPVKKITQKEPESSANDTTISDKLVNFPIKSRPGKKFICKIYDDFDAHPLNTVVEIIGFLAKPAPIEEVLVSALDSEMQCESKPTGMPVPIIHAIEIKHLLHSNPMELQMERSVEEIFSWLLKAVSEIMFRDTIAAEYFICHLLSSVYVRRDVEILGKFTLNLCNVPSGILPKFTSSIYEIIETLVPCSHYLPMELSILNNTKFIPKKNYSTDILESGLLQLPQHTHLMLDETKMNTGELQANGVNAISSLAYLIRRQTVKYDFEIYQLDFESNIPVIIMSEGRSMLPSDVLVPLLKPTDDEININEESFNAFMNFIKQYLNDIRVYLTKQRIQEFKMDSKFIELIQEDFVKLRQEHKISVDDFHMLLVLSRLLGLARGRSVLDMECWERAKELELERKRRVSLLPQPGSILRNIS